MDRRRLDITNHIRLRCGENLKMKGGAMSDATLTEVQREKQELEYEISRLIEEFSNKHGITIEGASVEHDPVKTVAQTGDIVNNIRYSVKLRIWI